MRVLFAVSEVHPYVKTGGLADVAAALPRGLCDLDVDVRLLLPGYPSVIRGCRDLGVVAEIEAWAGLPSCRLLLGHASALDLPALIVDCASLYARDGGPYTDSYGSDWNDNDARFALLSRVAALLASAQSPLAWAPQLLHCHDWQTGLAPAYLHFQGGARAATLLTIHNLAYQGIFTPDVIFKLGLPPESYSINGIEYYGNISFLKAGIFFADRISTVSPSYAQEIQHDGLGFGLQGLLATRAADLVGILNGIDTEAWDPARDVHITQTYDAANIEAKRANAVALRQRFGLTQRADTLLIGIVSRLTHQKGLDVVLQALPQLLQLPAQLVVLGSGEPGLERAWRQAALDYAGQVGVTIGFDEALSHLIEAGVDAFLMPSRFEPCGLNQMYSQRYGSLPIVHATGGLRDSVSDTTPETLESGTASGFVFAPLDVPTLLHCLQRVHELWCQPDVWRSVQRQAMLRDFSWKHSAQAYLDLYESMISYGSR